MHYFKESCAKKTEMLLESMPDSLENKHSLMRLLKKKDMKKAILCAIK